ncbi:MAG: ATP-dependent Clp protease proteolytic subunit [Planctomycetota bacterium]|jgi:ATP-dependent Clp protease protease subunit
MGYTVPIVIEKTGKGEKAYDIFSRLLKDRIIFIGSPIDDAISSLVIAEMLYLQSEKKNADINLYINSPGGSVTAGLAIYDTMQFVQCDVATYCIGQAVSIGALLLGAGTEKKRFALPNSRIMLHQPLGGIQGTASDLNIAAEEIVRLRDNVNEVLARHTGQTKARIEEDSDRDFFMSAQEAKEYGLVDDVIESLKKFDETSQKPSAK